MAVSCGSGYKCSRSASEIVAEFNGYMAKTGGASRDWYVGIAADPKDRLFNDTAVREQGDAWIYDDAGSSAVARQVEKHFIEVLGTDGGDGGGSVATRYVYAYKKAYHTKP